MHRIFDQLSHLLVYMTTEIFNTFHINTVGGKKSLKIPKGGNQNP